MLTLRLFPDPILRKKAEEVTDFSNVSSIVKEMFAIMKTHEGIGLAANQAGVLKRVFVMQLPDAESPQAFLNPKVIKSSTDKYKYEEGCLSLPGVSGFISRPKTITLTWQDIEGQQHEQEFSDLASTCIQHEIDHLDGILFPDRVANPLSREKIWKKLKNLLKKN